MVRNYKRKKSGPTYTKDDLTSAVELIQVQKLTYREVSTRLNIPLGTLSSHVLKSIKPNAGHPPTLTMDDEQHLVKLIITLQEWGQLSTCNDVLRYAEEYTDLMDLKSRFLGGKPTKDWYYGFLKRWCSDLKVMHSSPLENDRAKGVTQEILNGWFGTLENVSNALDLFNQSQNMFNTDESGFVQEVGCRVLVVQRGTKHASQ